MDSAIQVYSNDEFSVRTTTDTDGKVWFVARDIAEALDYEIDGGIGKYFAHVPDCRKGGKRIATPGGVQEMLCLTEQGVYFFLGRSDKPKAMPYQMWVAGEIMPSLRETGSYSTQKEQSVMSAGVMEGAKVVFEAAKIEDNQLALALDKFFRSYTGHSALKEGGIEIEAPTKHQLLTPTEIGKEFGMSAREVNNILAGAGW